MIAILKLLGFVLWTVVCCVTIILMPTNKKRLQMCGVWGVGGLKILNITLSVKGSMPKSAPFIIVSNHFGFVDIMAIMALKGVRFVAKSELRNIPIIGYAMHRSGQVFICRAKGKAKKHLQGIQNALKEGDNLAIFLEGTTNDCQTLLPFKSTLLRIVEDEYKPCDFDIVPIALAYQGLDERQKFLIKWGDTSIGQYLWDICSVGRASFVIDIAEVIEIDRTGLCAKEVTASCESVIAGKFYTMVNK